MADEPTITERPTIESEIATLQDDVAGFKKVFEDGMANLESRVGKLEEGGGTELAALKKRLDDAGLVRDPVEEPAAKETAEQELHPAAQARQTARAEIVEEPAKD